MQEAAELHKENIKLKQRCNVLETEIRALRYDLTAVQRHLHLPVTISAMGVEEDSTNYRRKKSQVAVSILQMLAHTLHQLLGRMCNAVLCAYTCETALLIKYLDLFVISQQYKIQQCIVSQPRKPMYVLCTLCHCPLQIYVDRYAQHLQVQVR